MSKQSVTYRWRNGLRVEGNLSAQVFGEYLRKRLGETATAEQIVELAEPKTSPIRCGFVFDDAECGKRYI